MKRLHVISVEAKLVLVSSATRMSRAAVAAHSAVQGGLRPPEGDGSRLSVKRQVQWSPVLDLCRLSRVQYRLYLLGLSHTGMCKSVFPKLQTHETFLKLNVSICVVL